MSDMNTTRPVSGDPEVLHEYDEDGNSYDPSVGWDLSFGCNSSIGYQDGQLVATVNTSDEDKRAGITHRTVTREQVLDYAHKLIALVGESAPGTAIDDLRDHLGLPEAAEPTDIVMHVKGALVGAVEIAAELQQLRAAVAAIREMADTSSGDDHWSDTSAHACEGRGEPDCALCWAQGVEFTLAKHLGGECDGGYQCSAAEHIDGCLSGDTAPQQTAGAR